MCWLGLALLGSSHALTLAGTVTGNFAPQTRISAWVVSSAGQPVQELASSALQGGKFSLQIPADAPPAKLQKSLNAQSLVWPGMVAPVSISGAAQVAEVKFYTYKDANANAVRDSTEALQEELLNVGRNSLFIVWSSGPLTVQANKGYNAKLLTGWNALSIEVGKTVTVNSLKDGAAVILSGE